MPRQRRPSQYQSSGPKLLQLQNLGGCFVVFFLRGQNRNFEKVRGLKLQLSLFFNTIYELCANKRIKFSIGNFSLDIVIECLNWR